MVEANQIIGFVTVGLSCLNVILAILVFAVANWVVECRFWASASLWHVCIFGQCVRLSPAPGNLNEVRALVFLGMFAMLGATAMTGVHVFLVKDNRRVMYASICLAAVAGFFLMFGVAHYADNPKMYEEECSVGPGFILCIVAGIFAWIAAILNGILVKYLDLISHRPEWISHRHN